MLNAWVYYLAVKDWNDMSLICDDSQFQSLDCFNESGGLVSHGWSCLFSSIPNMCVFDTAKVSFGSVSFLFSSRMMVVRMKIDHIWRSSMF